MTEIQKKPKITKRFFAQTAAVLTICMLPLLVIFSLSGPPKSTSPKNPPLEAIQEGLLFPDISLHRLSQQAHDSKKLSTIQAPLILINFWATWCAPCLVEMPSLLRLYNKYKEEGFKIIFINVDDPPFDEALQKLNDLKINFETYQDSDFKLRNELQIMGIPFTIILDNNKNILYLERGQRDWNASEIHEQFKIWLHSK